MLREMRDKNLLSCKESIRGYLTNRDDKLNPRGRDCER